MGAEAELVADDGPAVHSGDGGGQVSALPAVQGGGEVSSVLAMLGEGGSEAGSLFDAVVGAARGVRAHRARASPSRTA